MLAIVEILFASLLLVTFFAVFFNDHKTSIQRAENHAHSAPSPKKVLLFGKQQSK